MSPNTRPYRNQHVELARLAAAIPVDASAVNPRETAQALGCLKSVLIVHVKLQDGMLYPWMMRYPSAAMRDKAQQYRATSNALLGSFLEFYRRWTNPDAIAADPEAFVSAWRTLLALLRHRLAAEASDLYRTIDAADAPAAIALAS